jgi:hypothetical protein
MYIPLLTDLRQIPLTWTESWAGLSNYLAMPSMLKTAITYLAAFQASSSVIASRQVPVVDGIIGGVPSSSGTAKSAAPLTSLVTTPGKLRVTENSGVCGKSPVF